MSEAKKKSEDFEAEMDQFFKDRSLSLGLNIEQEKNDNPPKQEGENFKPGSGCCMTECPDCPWGYRVPSQS